MRWILRKLPDWMTRLFGRIRSGKPGAADAKLTKLADLKKRLMANPEFRAEYAEAREEFAVIEEMLRARASAGLTQEALAQRLGTTQSAIARLEGGRVSPSVGTLRRYAAATGKRLRVEMV